MAAALTFCRHLGRGGAAVLSLPRGARCFGVHISPTGEKVTHTGQAYDDKDYRKIRFVGRQKEMLLQKSSDRMKRVTAGRPGEVWAQPHHWDPPGKRRCSGASREAVVWVWLQQSCQHQRAECPDWSPRAGL
ncbi:NADH:ubiquinone oxidoreductase subunit S6 [Phyllostomus discolor]|uniref:NADH:ubiquinone oxidoreductase subunit S6 n=1 Tax=Phyllostomus discolor TaxID=89673 RepID=A0A834BAW3_9CHIR|nr:NADH:ubiquinone oxidoreductase subunit S6 [Phyllostomus discolor]